MLETLKAYQAWRRGEDKRTLAETDLTPTVIGQAIDWAIEQIEAQQAQPEDWKKKIHQSRDDAKSALDAWASADGDDK
jgi:hypothetical protein